MCGFGTLRAEPSASASRPGETMVEVKNGEQVLTKTHVATTHTDGLCDRKRSRNKDERVLKGKIPVGIENGEVCCSKRRAGKKKPGSMGEPDITAASTQRC